MRVITGMNYLMKYIIGGKTIISFKKNRHITSCVMGEVVGQLSVRFHIFYTNKSAKMM
jgi:hypothetical protein